MGARSWSPPASTEPPTKCGRWRTSSHPHPNRNRIMSPIAAGLGNLGLPRSVIMNMRNVLTIVYFVLTIYSFSGGLVHGVANYSSWKLISAEDFPAVHTYVDKRTL